MAFSKSAEWTEVQLPPSEQDEAADLSGLVAAAKTATSANSRILLSTEGYVDIVSLTSAITLHPELSGLCRIGSVVAVVKPTNFSINICCQGIVVEWKNICPTNIVVETHQVSIQVIVFHRIR